MPSLKARLSRQAIRLPNARKATRPLAADPTSGQPAQPASRGASRKPEPGPYDLILALYLSVDGSAPEDWSYTYIAATRQEK